MTIFALDYFADRMQHSTNQDRRAAAKRRRSNETSETGGPSHLNVGESSEQPAKKPMGKRPGKRPGRKPAKIDERAKLERSRQSARECRARKKLRYQYLEELVLTREKAVFALRDELETFKQWCLQLDQGGPLPETLLRAIVSEDMKVSRNQERQEAKVGAQRRLVAKTAAGSSQERRDLLSEEMSSSQRLLVPHLSPPMAQEQVQMHQLQHHQQSGFQQHQQSLHQQQPQLLQQQRVSQQQFQPQPSVLKRQMAFDQSSNLASSPMDLISASSSSSSLPSSVSHPQQTTVQIQSQLPQQQHVRHLQQQQQQSQEQQQSQHHHQSSTHSTVPQFLSAPSTSTFPGARGQGNPKLSSVPRVKSEPPFLHQRFVSEFSPAASSASPRVEVTRGRSLSNPVTMATTTRRNLQGCSVRQLEDTDMRTITGTGRTTAFAPQSAFSTIPESLSPVSTSVGLFSGQPQVVAGSQLVRGSSSTIASSAITVDDSSSSDESYPETHLFRSSLGPEKRTLSDPYLTTRSSETVQPTTVVQAGRGRPQGQGQPYLASSSSTLTQGMENPLLGTTTSGSDFDPHATLSHLTTVRCFGATRTSNTPSPSPFGPFPMGAMASPHGGVASPASTTSLGQNSPSPAPLSSLSSFLDPRGGGAGASSTSSLPSVSGSLESFLGLPTCEASPASVPSPSVQCSQTGLSATISEEIPEFYSFLEDLEDLGGVGSYTSRHGASSGQGTPMALTPKPSDQPVTPDVNLLNVPNIIDDYLHQDQH